MTPLERALLEALEALHPVALKGVQSLSDREAIDKADNAISLAHRTAKGEYHASIKEST